MEFKEKIKGLVDEMKVNDELPQAKRIKGNISIDMVIKACGDFYGRDHEYLLKRGKGKKERDVAMYLSKVLSGKTHEGIGKYFGIKKSAVGECVKKIENSILRDEGLKEEIAAIKTNNNWKMEV